MKPFTCAVALCLAAACGAPTPIHPDTGFLDRAVTVGGATSRYQVYVPADYSLDRTWPVLVDLHAYGMQGTDGLVQTVRGMAEQIRRDRSRFPVIAVFPQAAVGKRWFEGEMEDLVIAELDQVMAEFRGDPARVYLTGFSMGATGAYRIAARWPGRFAAIAVVAGMVDTASSAYPDEDKAADGVANPFVRERDPFTALTALIAHVPMAIHHGAADESVPVEQSRRLAAALAAAGVTVRYEEYAGAGHVGAAEQAYDDPSLTTWLFAQRR